MALSDDILKLKELAKGGNPLQAGMEQTGGGVFGPNAPTINPLASQATGQEALQRGVQLDPFLQMGETLFSPNVLERRAQGYNPSDNMAKRLRGAAAEHRADDALLAGPNPLMAPQVAQTVAFQPVQQLGTQFDPNAQPSPFAAAQPQVAPQQPLMDTLGAQPFNPNVTPPLQNLGVPTQAPIQVAPDTPSIPTINQDGVDVPLSGERLKKWQEFMRADNQGAGATPTPNATAPSPTIDPSSRIPQDMQKRIAELNEVFARPNLVQNGSLASPSPAPTGAEFDFSGIPNVSDTGLSEEAFGRLSPTAQGSISGNDGITTFQGMDAGGGQTAPLGMSPTIGPDGKPVLAHYRIAKELHEQELSTQREDRAAQQRFLASPEAKEFSSRQLRSAIMGDGQFGRESVAREQRAAESFGQPRGPDSRDRDRRGTMSMEQATRLTGGDRVAARALIERPNMPLTPEQQLAQRRQEFAESKPVAETALDNKVSAIMNATGVSLSEATGIATGSTRIQTNPVTGAASIVDIATGEARPITGLSQKTTPSFESIPPQEGKSLFDMAAGTTGAFEGFKRAAQGITGQLGVDVATDESIQAKQTFDTAQSALVRAFMQGGRFSATEAKMLREELDISPSALKDPKTLKNKLRSIDKSLETRMKTAINIIQSPDMPAEEKRDAMGRAQAISDFRALLGVPQEGEDNGAESGMAPEGVSSDIADVWEFLTPSERTQLTGK